MTACQSHTEAAFSRGLFFGDIPDFQEMGTGLKLLTTRRFPVRKVFRPAGRARFKNVRTDILGVRSSLTARLNIFKNGESRRTTAARGRSLLAALYAGRKTFRTGKLRHLEIQPRPHFLEIRNVPIRTGCCDADYCMDDDLVHSLTSHA